MTRIRYKKQNNLFVSKLFTLSSNVIAMAKIYAVNTNDIIGEIVTVDGKTLDRVQAGNTRKVKYLIRTSLMELGLNLEGEVRNKQTYP